MNQAQWSDVSFTLNGDPFPMTSGVYSSKSEYGFDTKAFLPEKYEVNVTVPVKLDELTLAGLFGGAPMGASHKTLVRRVGYGGRKGRSALRRLFERALPIFFTTNEGARLRGRAVSMSETDFEVRLHGQR